MNEIILIGNPNVGKTTLFNTLTGSNQRVSNWHGVTVSECKRRCVIKDKNFIVTDLPGIYGLNSYSNEEKIARDYLLKHKDCLVVNICDANNFERNFKLTVELLELGLKIIVAVNMSNEVKLYDYNRIEKQFHIKIVEIDARNKKGVKGLKDAILGQNSAEKPQKTTKTIKNHAINEDILQKYKRCNVNKVKITSNKIDKIILNKILFVILFIASLFFIFNITFGAVGSYISNVFSILLKQIIEKMQKIILCTNINKIIKLFICDVIFESFVSIMSFVPQVVLLMLFLNLIEDSGLMARVSFMFDGLLKKVGLTGKSLFSIFLGYGCTTTAIMTTRNIENFNLRKRTALVLPFSSCSAKLPVFLVVSSLFFDKYKHLCVFGVYLFSIFISLAIAVVSNKLLKHEQDVFVMEMPTLRLPYLKKVAKDVFCIVKDFVVKVGSVIFVFGTAMWLLKNISVDFKFLSGENFDNSLLFFLAEKLQPIFSIIGLGNIGVICSLFMGLVAKEMIVVGFLILNGVQNVSLLQMSLINPESVCFFTPISSIVFLVFVLIYSPCFSAIAVLKNEFGFKMALFVFIFQFILAFIFSFLVYLSLTNVVVLKIFALLIILAIFFCVVLKLNRKYKCRGNCCECGKI